MPAGERFIIPLWTDPDSGILWFVLDAGPVRLGAVVQSHRPRSCITAEVKLKLLQADAISSSDRDFTEDLSISQVTLVGIPCFSIPVEVGAAPGRFGVELILGFDFLARFTDANFVFPPHRLILVDP